jgi:hypothetical protein
VWDYTGVSVTSSTFAGNGAGAGGDGSTTYFLRGAGSGGSGGGVFVDVGSAKLLNATLAGNSAGARGTGIGGYAPGVDGSGGGVAAAFTALTVQNSLLAANKPTNCASGTATDAGHNISFAGGGCPASFGPGDPKLGPLQDNGGPTLTMALGRGSAAIDQIPTFGASCPLRDQRGVRRSGGRDCDIGAYEVAAPRVERVAAQATGARTVRILVTVAANARQAAIWVRYGRTKRYGSRSAAHELRGVGPTTVSFVLRGLDLRRTYHYRIIASSPDGRSRTVDIGLAVPVLSGLVIRRAGGGATLSYTDSRAGVTVVDVQRRVRGRWVAVGTFSHRDQVGRDSVRLGRRLGRGRYRIEARPRTGRTRGVTRTVRFTIVA